MMNKIILISGLALALALATEFKYLSNAVAPQRQATPQSSPLPEARVLGLLGDEALAAPTTVLANKDFQVTITTTGSGCEREGDTSVIISEDSATVMVYDFTMATRPGVACSLVLKRLRHTATLRFTKPGMALIRVWGRRFGSDTPLPVGAPTVLEHRVMVR
jgi:hypothetical protein